MAVYEGIFQPMVDAEEAPASPGSPGDAGAYDGIFFGVEEFLPPTFGITVSVATIPNDGGHLLTVTGVFAEDKYKVRLGPNGDSTDPVCQPKLVGGGQFAQVKNGTTLDLVTPIVAIGGPYKLSFENELGTLTLSTDALITVIAHQFRDRIFGLRRHFVNKLHVGIRKSEDEDFPQS